MDSKTKAEAAKNVEKAVIKDSATPQSVENKNQVASQHKDVLGDALCYKYKDSMLFDQLLQLMLRATEDSATTLSKELINETFDVISGEFDHFLQATDVFTEDRINVLFMCFDHWFDTFKDLADDVFSTCQQTLRPKSRKKSDADAARVKEKKAQAMAMFIIEKAIVTVSGIKANILYNHQYFEQVFYNINGWEKEDVLAEMERLEDAFGVGRERDILFSKYANIEAFYEKLVEIVRGGLLEVHNTADTMSDEERLETFRSLLKAEVDFDLPMYIDLVKMERDFSTETYHSAVSWVETTKYCLYQVLIEAERKIAEDEDLSVEIDYAYFQKSNLAFIPNMFAEALAEYESNTGSIEIDEKLNHLGERDEDDWDSEVPIFDSSLLGEDFITEEDLDNQKDLTEEVVDGDDTMTGTTSEKIPDASGTTTKRKKGKPRKVFKDCVVKQDDANKMIKVLHTMLDGKSGESAYRILFSAWKGGLILKPSYNAIKAEFDIGGAESGYNTYMGKKNVPKEDYEPLSNRIEIEVSKMS